MRTVIKESQRTPAGGGIVDHLRNHRLVFSEIKFVAYADLARRLHKHIPQLVLGVQLTEKKDFDTGTGLLLVSI